MCDNVFFARMNKWILKPTPFRSCSICLTPSIYITVDRWYIYIYTSSICTETSYNMEPLNTGVSVAHRYWKFRVSGQFTSPSSCTVKTWPALSPAQAAFVVFRCIFGCFCWQVGSPVRRLSRLLVWATARISAARRGTGRYIYRYFPRQK